MDHPQMVTVAAAALCIHQLLAAFTIIFDDVPTVSEAREARAVKRYKHELTYYKRNLSVTYGVIATSNLWMHRAAVATVTM
jgi:hypothetical protein